VLTINASSASALALESARASVLVHFAAAVTPRRRQH